MSAPTILEPHQSLEEVKRLLLKYPVDPSFTYRYGTAGFRYAATLLDGVMVRVACAAAWTADQGTDALGIMVTASHNDESYNGVKMAAGDGGMVDETAEQLAVELVNEPSVERILQRFPLQSTPTIHIGRDTREHSPALASLLTRTLSALGAVVVDHGVVTTPMLHHCVRHANPHHLPMSIPQRVEATGYYRLLVDSYLALLHSSRHRQRRRILRLDCACGVGHPHAAALWSMIEADTSTVLQLANAPGTGPLNTDCGSEHVQKQQAPPKWYDADTNSHTDYCASVDGDADRLVFFAYNDKQFTLLDGDKMSCLIADFVQAQLSELASIGLPLPRFGVVQTAYANGASSDYLRQIVGTANVVVAKTGVKFVHAAAHNFDIGIYFEANGHGTIIFGPAFYQFMEETRAQADQGALHVAWQRLATLPSLVNQAIGDALSDLLLIDAILQLQDWTLDDWNALYKDLPSRQCKVRVRDRLVIQTNDNETRCTQPRALQRALDAAMRHYSGRAFVRPSGTEDVVRVYAEAPSRAAADGLASRAAELVYHHCDGVGELPVFPVSRI